jgi:IMP dehydrogenase
MLEQKIKEGLSFDDVLILPAKSDVIPAQADVSTIFSRNIKASIPIVSSAMDTVTESKMAIALAQQGGIGVIHRNMPIEEQAEVVGILTNRDIRFETRLNLAIDKVMTKDLVTVPLGTSLEEAEKLFHKHKIEKILMVDENFQLKGLITYRDILKRIQYPHAAKDSYGRLRVGAAVGVAKETLERVKALIQAKLDVLVIDTAHGHSKRVLETVKMLKKEFPEQELVAGNIGTGEAARELIDLGVDAVKVGVGPGSICTTRVVTGAGIPQITAIADVFKVTSTKNIPLIADGGIIYSGDITKAIAAGADTVMLGNVLAGTDESPGERSLPLRGSKAE